MTPPTNPSALDRAFARFCETGDPAALGKVFDATAPELLRLANHLISDLGVAEDLVQATFLAAIQSCRDYDARKPVLPWLVGILTNRARLHQRNRGRKPDPDRLQQGESPNPAGAAEAKELTKAVTDAIAGMPDPYRPVLMMHLRHGFSAQEVALTLGRAPGTVRKQLSRGLGLLRRALPAGIAVTVASAILPTQGLAAMRHVVLGAGKLAAPASVGTAATATTATTTATAATTATTATTATFAPMAIGGVLLMKKSLLTAVAVVGVASVAWLAWPHLLSQDVAGHDGGDLSTVGALTGETEQEPPVTSAPSSASQQAGRKQLANPAEGTGSDTMVLKGRCVSRSTGSPLAGCWVRLKGYVRNDEAFEAYVIEHGNIKRKETWTQTTGSDGRFEFHFVPHLPHTHSLSIQNQGLVPLSASWKQLQRGTIKDLGDIALDPGAIVSGRILDAKGRPLERKGFWFKLQGGKKTHGEMGAATVVHITSRRDGVFTTRPIQPGTWRNELQRSYRNDDRYSVAPEEFAIVPDQRHLQIDFVFREPPPVKDYISGQVIDESGLPVRRLQVGGVNSSGWFVGGYTDSDKDGRFRVRRERDQSTDPVALGVAGKGFETLITKKKYAWGTEKVKLTVRRGLPVEILVKDGVTGEPVEEFGVRCFRDGPGGYPNPDCSLQLLGRHPGGRLILKGVRRGKKLLLVEPRGERYLPSGFHRFTVTDQGTPIQVISLHRPAERRLKVVRGDGAAVEGTQIELLAPFAPGPVNLDTLVRKRTRMNYYGGRNQALLTCSGRTNAAGEFMLIGQLGESFGLRVLGPGHQATVRNGVLLDPKLGTLRIEVPSGATVVGRLSPAKLVTQFAVPLKVAKLTNNDPWIKLHRIGARHESFPSHNLGRIGITNDGRFEAVGIPPGRWELLLSFWVPMDGVYTAASEPLATLQLEQGKKRELNIDIGHLAAGRLNGKVYVNGKPLAGARLGLSGSKPDNKGGTRSSASVYATTDKRGAFQVQILPATYRLGVVLPASLFGRHATLRAPDQLVIAPGQVVDRVFQLHYRSLRLRVLSSDGKTPVKGVHVEVHLPGNAGYHRMPKTDAEGKTVRKGVSCVLLEFKMWPRHLATRQAQDQLARKDPAAWKSARIVLGTLRLPPGDGEFRHQLVLPASSGY